MLTHTLFPAHQDDSAVSWSPKSSVFFNIFLNGQHPHITALHHAAQLATGNHCVMRHNWPQATTVPYSTTGHKQHNWPQATTVPYSTTGHKQPLCHTAQLATGNHCAIQHNWPQATTVPYGTTGHRQPLCYMAQLATGNNCAIQHNWPQATIVPYSTTGHRQPLCHAAQLGTSNHCTEMTTSSLQQF